MHTCWMYFSGLVTTIPSLSALGINGGGLQPLGVILTVRLKGTEGLGNTGAPRSSAAHAATLTSLTLGASSLL